MIQKIQSWCQRDEVQTRLTGGVLTGIAVVYGIIAWFGRGATPSDAHLPIYVRFHPERLLAIGAAVLGIFRLIRRSQEDQPILGPLLWIFFASLVHLTSLAIQLRWV